VSGFQLAVTMSNSGGAWDNAKKYVEKDGLGSGRSKGSDCHKATVVGDTVGDPFKDTSGPALNILIKLMSIVSLVLAPVFRDCCVTDFHTESGWATGIAALVIMIVLSVFILKYIGSVNAAWYEQIDKMAAEVKGSNKPSHSLSFDQTEDSKVEIEMGEVKGDTK